ncbi:MAG TPA: ankyrin repeat domain-containing protein [Opitutales bacterium]|nr:ankyrin repeat domain-containing protein [Opitutales bacterium]
MTPLHLAADFEGVDAAGRPLAVDFVERLIDFQRQFQSTFSLFINARDRLNRTALHLAAARGDAAVVELLLAADAWLLTQDMQDRTPVWIAAQAGHVGPLELMIRSVERPHLLFRVVPQGASFWDFQHNPAVWGIIGRYVMMAEGQPSVTMTTTTDLNRVADTVALPCAVDPGLVQFYFYQAIGSEDLRALIEAIDIYGADVNARDQGGWTALWIAAARANLPMVQALLDRGAALNEIPPSYPRGATLLHLAAAHTNYDLAACLIARGFNMYAVDGFGQTPLSIAANQAQGNVLALFEAEAQRAHQQMLADAPVMPVARALPDGMPSVLLDAVSRGDIDYVDLLLGGYRYERGDLEAALSVARGLGYDTIQARIEQQLVPLRVAGVALHRSI